MKNSFLIIFVILLSFDLFSQKVYKDNSPGYELACFYFPNYHMTDKRNQERYGTAWSEWNLVKNAKPRFKGHEQPKIPIWGYTDESNPDVMKMKIDAASKYGIDVFIYDWYYYNDGPFLEKGLEEGFLKAENNYKMKFCIMWANHDWVDLFPRDFNIKNPPLFYPGAITIETFMKMTDYIIEKYFKHPSYWKIDNCPVFSIYQLNTFIEGLKGIVNAKKALDNFRDKTKKAGFKDLHLNAITWGVQILPSEKKLNNLQEVIDYFNVNSTTSYVWVHHYDPGSDGFPEVEYQKAEDKYFSYCDKEPLNFKVPYYPNVSMGWDATPRCSTSKPFSNYGYPCMTILKNNTPEAFKNALMRAKEWADKNEKGTKVITINSWNEWTEGSMLEPERKYGYQYLEAVKQVFGKN